MKTLFELTQLAIEWGSLLAPAVGGAMVFGTFVISLASYRLQRRAAEPPVPVIICRCKERRDIAGWVDAVIEAHNNTAMAYSLTGVKLLQPTTGVCLMSPHPFERINGLNEAVIDGELLRQAVPSGREFGCDMLLRPGQVLSLTMLFWISPSMRSTSEIMASMEVALLRHDRTHKCIAIAVNSRLNADMTSMKVAN